jgi:hypothetical protein
MTERLISLHLSMAYVTPYASVLRFSYLHLITDKYDRSVITNLEPRPACLFYIA